MIDNEILELVKTQESYRSELTHLMSDDIHGDNRIIYDISEVLLKVNLITKEIYSKGISDDLHELYCEYVIYLENEEYLKCKDILEKINNYECQKKTK